MLCFFEHVVLLKYLYLQDILFLKTNKSQINPSCSVSYAPVFFFSVLHFKILDACVKPIFL